METYSLREAAKKLGISVFALSKYVKTGKVNPPAHTVKAGPRRIHAWTEAEIEHVRKLLPRIANGRKTRYQKKHSAVSTQQSGKTKTKKKSTKQIPRARTRRSE